MHVYNSITFNYINIFFKNKKMTEIMGILKSEWQVQDLVFQQPKEKLPQTEVFKYT